MITIIMAIVDSLRNKMLNDFYILNENANLDESYTRKEKIKMNAFMRS